MGPGGISLGFLAAVHRLTGLSLRLMEDLDMVTGWAGLWDVTLGSHYSRAAFVAVHLVSAVAAVGGVAAQPWHNEVWQANRGGSTPLPGCLRAAVHVQSEGLALHDNPAQTLCSLNCHLFFCPAARRPPSSVPSYRAHVMLHVRTRCWRRPSYR